MIAQALSKVRFFRQVLLPSWHPRFPLAEPAGSLTLLFATRDLRQSGTFISQATPAWIAVDTYTYCTLLLPFSKTRANVTLELWHLSVDTPISRGLF